MADYDSNMIKPVDGLQNIKGLTPAKRREERKHRQKLHKKNTEDDDTAEDRETLPEERTENVNDRDNGGIDYCA